MRHLYSLTVSCAFLLMNAHGASAQQTFAGLWYDDDGQYYWYWQPDTGQLDTLFKVKANNAPWSHVNHRIEMAANGKLYGAVRDGGPWRRGVIYRADTATGAIKNVHDFLDPMDGSQPSTIFHHLGNDQFIGVTDEGGLHDNGVIFQFDASTNTYSKLLDLSDDWNHTQAGLVHTDGHLYLFGQVSGWGSLYRYDLQADTLTLEFDMPNNQGGANIRHMTSHPDGSILITARTAGPNRGRIYQTQPGSGSYTTVYSFLSNPVPGSVPHDPIFTSYHPQDSMLYVSCTKGGPFLGGGLVRVDPQTLQRTELQSYVGNNGTWDLHDLHWLDADTLLVTVGSPAPNTIAYHRYVRGGSATELFLDTDNVDLASNNYFDGNTCYQSVYALNTCQEMQLRRCTWPGMTIDTVGATQHDLFYAMTRRGAVRPDSTFLVLGNTFCNRMVMLSYDPDTGVADTVAIQDGVKLATPHILPYFQGDSLFVGIAEPGNGSADFHVFTWNANTGAYDSLLALPPGLYARTAMIGTGNGRYYYGAGLGSQSFLVEVDLMDQTAAIAHTLSASEGQFINNGLIVASNGSIYGTAYTGGSEGKGSLFSYEPDSGHFVLRYSFGFVGDNPIPYLVERTSTGGQQVLVGGVARINGRVYQIELDGSNLTWLTPSLPPTCGSQWYSPFTPGSDGLLYGVGSFGAQPDSIVLQRVDPVAGTVTCLERFDHVYGAGIGESLELTEIIGAPPIITTVQDRPPEPQHVLMHPCGPAACFSWSGPEKAEYFAVHDIAGRLLHQIPLNGTSTWQVPERILPRGLLIGRLVDVRGGQHAVRFIAPL